MSIRIAAGKRVNKYGNCKTIVDDKTFDSKAEALRYTQLKLLERAGQISNLRLQPKYLLAPRTETESKCEYIADFEYEENGTIVVEDVKGHTPKDYIVKRKWFKIKYPEYDFREIKTSML